MKRILSVLAISTLLLASCSRPPANNDERPADEISSSEADEIWPTSADIAAASASEESRESASAEAPPPPPSKLDVENDSTLTNGSNTYMQSYITYDTESGCSYVTHVFVVNNGDSVSTAMNTFKRAVPCKK